MLKTYYDIQIMSDFLVSRPSDFWNSGCDEQKLWFEYDHFLKSGTDLVITNTNKYNNLEFLQLLTTGRGEKARLLFEPDFSGFYKQCVPGKYGKQDVFFLNEPNHDFQENYRRKNSNFFGFLVDHIQAFKKFAQIDNKLRILVRRNEKYNEFTSWKLLNNYLLPFSYCLIIDNYLFSEDYFEQNLKEILLQLNQSAPLGFNLIFLTYAGDNKEKKASSILKELDNFKCRYNLKANISVIIDSKKFEKDRNILMNYLRINSGRSFNYFNTQNKVRFNTEISFLPYFKEENFFNSEVILKDIMPRVAEIKELGNPDQFAGNMNFHFF